MSTRKRLRQTEEEEDELTTTISATKNPKSPFPPAITVNGSTSKKRKLNSYGSLKKMIGGVFLGWNGGKDGKEEREKDELADEEEEDTSLGKGKENLNGNTMKGKGKGGKGKVKDVFDLPSSGEEEMVVRKKEKVTPKSVGRVKATPKSTKKRPTVDIFDVPESGGEDVERVGKGSAMGKAASAQKKGMTGGKAHKKGPVEEEETKKSKSTRKTSGRGKIIESASPEPEEVEVEPPKSSGRKPGRGRKGIDLVRDQEEVPVSTNKKVGRGKKAASPELENTEEEEELAVASSKKKVGRVKKAASLEPESGSEDEEKQAPKSSGRKGGRGKKAASPKPESEADEEEEEEEETAPKSSGRKGGHGKKAASPILSPQPLPPQTGAKKRGRPKKNLDAIIQDAKGTPKGILTPSKGRTLKSKKSVAFEAMDNNIDLGFKDIPVTTSVKKSKKFEVVQEEKEEEEHFNNDFCGICTKTHQRGGNKMVLCDGCDFAVHMKCYHLDSLPEGDTWFCKTCRPEHASDEEVEDIEVEEGETAPLEVTNPKLKKGEKKETCCAICSGLDSKLGNKIIICDGCEFAVHVKCYNLPTFPKGDWFCRTCLAAAGEDPFNLGIEDEAEAEADVDAAKSDIPDIVGFETHLRRAQRVVLDQLTGKRRVKLIGHDEEMQKVHQVVEQTILAGEGNSMLVIGARGCGKTTLVESVISDLSTDHKDSFHVVRLNGFIHTDDKIASKEIWRQLGKEMDAEDDAQGKPSNYADTLASLLALLSHPSENSEADVNETAKSVIFILDEFDLFTGHSRQTLLYNLFDIAQARKAPIVVLGLTTRVDVVESLEKRVKSRFSHRYVHLSLPRSIPSFWEICKQGLTISPEDFDEDIPGSSEFLSFWSKMIGDLFTQDPPFKQHLLAHFFRTKSIPTFYTSCLLPLSTLTSTTLPLKLPSLFLTPLTPPDSKLHTLQGLSELSLALLIAAARLDIILDTDTCNFAMAYDEYSSLTSRHKIQTSSSGVSALGGSAKVWGRDVALGCWERLQDGGLLIAAGGGMWKVDVGLEEIAGSVEGLSTVMGKWCREI